MTVAEQSRPGTPADAVDGVTPRFVAEPASGAACAAVLAAASAARQATVLRGGGTKIGWARPVDAVDLVVSTAGLSDLLVHRDGDLTATVGAGVPLSRLNTTLAARGQWLPVDSAFAATTVGGMLATNDSGPLRHRFGTPRDLLIGITLALTDGRLVKSGGTVVKNVAGYDLGKLVTGSYGALAAIVDATFKLLPLPHASATLSAVYTDPSALAADAARARLRAARAARVRRARRGDARWAALDAASCVSPPARRRCRRSSTRPGDAARRDHGVARRDRDARVGRAGGAAVERRRRGAALAAGFRHGCPRCWRSWPRSAPGARRCSRVASSPARVWCG